MQELRIKINTPYKKLFTGDELVNLLKQIDEKSVRDIKIKMKFKQLRASKVSTIDAFNALREYYPYLSIDNIKKIVYQANILTEKKNN